MSVTNATAAGSSLNSTAAGSSLPSSTSCSLSIDDSFGPYAGSQCRGGFDFTMLFEEVIMIIPLAAMLLLLTPLRVLHLSKRAIKARAGWLLMTKLAIAVLYTGLQLVTLVQWCYATHYKTRASIPASALQFVTGAILCILFFLEHTRTVRPSLMISAFLFLSILLDAARIRTLWLLNKNTAIAGFSSAGFGLQIALLGVESVEKRGLLSNTDQSYPPEATSGLFNRSVFFWLNKVLTAGYKKTLLVEDLFPVDRQLQSERVQTQFFYYWDKANKDGKYALLWVLLKLLKRPLLEGVVPRLFVIGLTFAQPFLINRAIELSDSPKNRVTNNDGYGIIGAYAIVYLGLAVAAGQYSHKTNRATVMMRAGLVAGIYSKTLDMPITAADPTAAITLMSTDVERISNGTTHIHETWANIVEVAIAIWLLERQLGVACIVPVVFGAVSVVGSGRVAGLVAKYQGAWMLAIQTRITVTAGVLGSMKSIKIAGLTNRVSSIVHNLRVVELAASKRLRRVMIWVVLFISCSTSNNTLVETDIHVAFFNPVMTPVLSFVVYALIAQAKNDRTLLAAKAFTALSLFSLLTTPLNTLLTSLPNITAALQCCARIQAYLKLPSRTDTRTLSSRSSQFIQRPNSEKSNDFLHDEKANMSLPSGDAIAVDGGNVGWVEGASVLRDVNVHIGWGEVAMILGPVGSGKSTLLKGLLGELPFVGWPARMGTKSVAFCDQTPWLPNRTIRKTIQGSYPLDKRWYKTVLRACALDHDLKQWQQGDLSIVGSKGITLSGGQKQRIALARAIYSNKKILMLDDVFSGLDAETEDQVFHRLFGASGLLREHHKTVVIVSSSGLRAPYVDRVIVLGTEGTIMEQGTFKNLKSQGGYVSSLGLSDATSKLGTDTWNAEELPDESIFSFTSAEDTNKADTSAADEANRSTGDITVYKYYAGSIGFLITLGFVSLVCCFVFANTFPDIWLNWWTAYNVKHPNGRLGKYLGVYAALGLTSVGTLTASCAIVFLLVIPKAGLHFHSILLNTVTRATISFFWTTDLGVTLNRFSQDLTNIDMELPMAALLSIITGLNCLAQLILIAVAVHWVAISFPFYLALFYCLQRFYLRTSRQMRFMDIESKSSVYAQFVESLAGLTTIRAFGWGDEAKSENCGFLDVTQRPYYLLLCIQRWLSFTIDTLIAFMAIILAVIAILLRSEISPGYMGVALVNVMSLNASMKLFLQSWTSLETSIGSVLRVRSFEASTESEDKPGASQTPPTDWPSDGSLKIQNLSASYRSGEPVLKNISMGIRPGEKVGICGRNGSGKSTLVLCLLRMMQPDEGLITIDGIDINLIEGEKVRERIVAVAQDAYTFSGTVRLNADPTELLSDRKIIEVLQKVRLWDTISAHGGLDQNLDLVALSQGQKQLFCFARAILRDTNILILDEAMASVDAETDAFIDELLHTEFSTHTIISIAHKLESILDYDRVALLDKGELVEFDDPSVLMAHDSAFRKLYNASKGTSGTDTAPPVPPKTSTGSVPDELPVQGHLRPVPRSRYQNTNSRPFSNVTTTSTQASDAETIHWIPFNPNLDEDDELE